MYLAPFVSDSAAFSASDPDALSSETVRRCAVALVSMSGALILGSGLGRDAASLTQGEKQGGWAWPAYIERTQEAFRAYYPYVPKGKFVEVVIPLYYEGHVYRAGSQIRVTISAPGGDQPVWSFAETQPDGTPWVAIAPTPISRSRSGIAS